MPRSNPALVLAVVAGDSGVAAAVVSQEREQLAGEAGLKGFERALVQKAPLGVRAWQGNDVPAACETLVEAQCADDLRFFPAHDVGRAPWVHAARARNDRDFGAAGIEAHDRAGHGSNVEGAGQIWRLLPSVARSDHAGEPHVHRPVSANPRCDGRGQRDGEPPRVGLRLRIRAELGDARTLPSFQYLRASTQEQP
jgi:hypothetical protein